ncbi:hypothetical protein [Sulfurimonas sp.]
MEKYGKLQSLKDAKFKRLAGVKKDKFVMMFVVYKRAAQKTDL